MNPAEYALMARVADEHWWYRGLRDAITRAVRRLGLLPEHPAAVLDAGCGTGENLRLLQTLLHPAYAGGFDLSPLALQFAREKCPDADLYASDLCDPSVHVPSLDVVLSCDVLSVPGLDAAKTGLQRLVAALRPGGALIVNLPAYQWLWSAHDAAVHQTHRFTAGQVRRLFRELGLKVELLSYRLCALFPLVALKRLPSLWRPPRDRTTVASDVALPARWINATLTSLLKAENLAIGCGIRWPWGSSVFAMGRKS